jgi:hypothetical protein
LSRGVISENEIFNVSDEEILEEMKDQGVCGARRITLRRDGKIIRTKHVVLTFNTPKVPNYVKVGYLKCPVRPFIPNPLRCFQCQRYGHSKAACRGSVVCARCGVAGHEMEKCNTSPKCINCKGDHPAFSRTCPKWIMEKEIQTVRVKQSISYIEARRLVESRTPKLGVSYSAATKISSQSVGTQTDSTQNSLHKASNLKPSNSKIIGDSKNKYSQSTSQNTNLSNTIENSQKSARKRTRLKNILKPQTKTLFTNRKKFTREDFLKKPPNLKAQNTDFLKMYVSPEEDLLSDFSNEVEFSTSAP